MAYNNTRQALDDTGKSILVQVAFKGAVDIARTDPTFQGLTTADYHQLFAETFGFLTDQLFGEVEARIGKPSPVGGYESGGWTDEDLGRTLATELGATPVPNQEQPAPNPAAGAVPTPGGLKVNYASEPIPDWLAAAAKKAGVTEVNDQRKYLAENPKKPHFKAADGQPLNAKGEPYAFWPPR